MKYPLWVKLAIALLAAYRALKQIDQTPGLRPRKALRELDKIYYSLPVVQNKPWTWLVERLIYWMDLQKLNLVILAQTGVQEVTLVQNDL